MLLEEPETVLTAALLVLVCAQQDAIRLVVDVLGVRDVLVQEDRHPVRTLVAQVADRLVLLAHHAVTLALVLAQDALDVPADVMVVAVLLRVRTVQGATSHAQLLAARHAERLVPDAEVAVVVVEDAVDVGMAARVAVERLVHQAVKAAAVHVITNVQVLANLLVVRLAEQLLLK